MAIASRPCPPPSAPRTTITSTPASSASSRSATEQTCVAVVMPASRSRRTGAAYSPKLTETSAGRNASTASSWCGASGRPQASSPMPYGVPPAPATAASCSIHSVDRSGATPIVPSPPARLTAWASRPPPGPAIGALMTGTRVRSDCGICMGPR